ncbi:MULTISPECIES: hypothetical protein [unclassified Ralstonia]|uniref:hypothetical protein n=1 Tax=unclassified Ralstonia TaxID=209769 RepID=UPI0011BE17E9|nr:hypothetical protein [Ralstonia sp. TCR112]TXD62958.1 hypothetical protein FUT88_04800 [Ralstonia sp. TCR112]
MKTESADSIESIYRRALCICATSRDAVGFKLAASIVDNSAPVLYLPWQWDGNRGDVPGRDAGVLQGG